MINQTKTIIMFGLILGILLVNFVNAELTQSNNGVYYNSNIFEEFEKTNNLEVLVFLKTNEEINSFLSDFQEKVELEDVSGNELFMRINLETFNLLIKDRRVNMILHENAFIDDDAKVEYDVEIRGQFLFNKWVPVMVDIKDMTNITILRNDTITMQEAKDKERHSILNNITNSVLSTLSYDEFRLEGKEGGYWFYGNITQKGFNKLLNDPRVKKIHDNTIKGYISTEIIVQRYFIYIIPILLVAVLIILLIKLRKKRRWKVKR